MFDFVRRHQRIIQILLFALIVPSFALLGVDSYSRMSQQGVAVAEAKGGVRVTEETLQFTVKQEIDQIRANNPKAEVAAIDTPAFRESVLNRMLNQQILEAAVKDQHLSASQQGLARALLADPRIAAFKGADGKLDMTAYAAMTATMNLSPEGYEQRVGQNLAMQNLLQAVSGSSFASKASDEAFMKNYLAKREVQTRTIKASEYADKVTVSDADTEAFYKKNLNLYTPPESANIEYVVLDAQALKSQVQVSEQELKEYYDKNAQQLSGGEERRASHVLIEVAKTASQADKDKAKALADEVYSKATAKPDSFAELAKTYSKDPGSKDNGGDLGFVARNGTFVKPFEDAIFTMKVGAVSKPVETQFGYHVIMLNEVKGDQPKTFAELRPKIEEDLKKQKGQKLYTDNAEEFSNLVYEQASSLKPAVDKLKLELKTATGVTNAGSPDEILGNAKFLKALFSNEVTQGKKNTPAIDLGQSRLVSARVTSYQPKVAQPLAQVKDNVKAQLIQEKGAEMASKEGAVMLAAWQKTPAEAKGLGAKLSVTRQDAKGLDAKVLNAILRADTKTLPAFAGVALPGQGYVIAKIESVSETEAKPEFTKSISQQLDQTRQQAQTAAFIEWLRVQYKAKILKTNFADDAAKDGKA